MLLFEAICTRYYLYDTDQFLGPVRTHVFMHTAHFSLQALYTGDLVVVTASATPGSPTDTYDFGNNRNTDHVYPDVQAFARQTWIVDLR